MTNSGVKELAQAIRLGAACRPQAFGEYYAAGATCALGAAAEAIGVPYDKIPVSDWHTLRALIVAFPELIQKVPRTKRMTLKRWIVRANDEWRWTREAIADALDDFADGEPLPVDIPKVQKALEEANRKLTHLEQLVEQGGTTKILQDEMIDLVEKIHDMKVELGEADR